MEVEASNSLTSQPHNHPSKIAARDFPTADMIHHSLFDFRTVSCTVRLVIRKLHNQNSLCTGKVTRQCHEQLQPGQAPCSMVRPSAQKWRNTLTQLCTCDGELVINSCFSSSVNIMTILLDAALPTIPFIRSSSHR